MTSTMNRQLTRQEEKELRAAVRGIADNYGNDYIEKVCAAGAAPDELWQELGQYGFLGVGAPESVGGGGMGLLAASIVTEEVAAAGCPLIMLMVSPGIVGGVLARNATPEQQQRWLAPMATGEIKLGFAITEPDAGSNTHNIATSAVREGDGWRIHGVKTFITGADQSQALLVVARTGVDEDTGHARISLFVVDTDTPGVSTNRMEMTFDATDSSTTVFFDDVLVDSDRLIGGEGNGLRAAFDGMNQERVLIGSISTGIGRYALDRAVAYAKVRNVWGVPIGAHQGLAQQLAEAKVQLEAARLMLRDASERYDAGKWAGTASTMAKLLAADAGIQCVDVAIETHGGSGFVKETGLGNMWHVARLFKTVPITRELVLTHVAEHILGLPKSY